VADVEDFLDAVRRVAKGGSVIDPEVISNLVGRPRKASPLDQLTLREREALTTASDSGFVERLWGERREAS
jgi:DNA-binding NarL/FixJ family response regulator